MNYRLKQLILMPVDLLYSISPKAALKFLFRMKVGYRLNLDDPKTYNEKINWLKLNYQDTRYQVCSDKYLVRDYVTQQGHGNLLNTLFWQGYDPDDLPISSLPDRFVLKVTHGSGFNIICHNKSEFDIQKTRKQLQKWLKYKYLKCYGEWWYGIERPRIIVEELLENKDGTPLFDYKFFCFNGEPKYVYVDTWKDGKHHINMYDAGMNRLPEVKLGYATDESSNITVPTNYDQMFAVAKSLAANFPHVRVDMYNLDDHRIVFGELTFSKGAGLDRIVPYAFDLEMGNALQLYKETTRKQL